MLNLENVVVSENNIFENWNVGRIAEEAIEKLPPDQISNFINSNVGTSGPFRVSSWKFLF